MSIAAVPAVFASWAGAANGHQPSPCSTTRRRARPVLPPIQIGGCGRVAGSGCAVIPRALKCRPSTVTSSSVQIARITASASSNSSLRSSYSTPSAANSRFEVAHADREREPAPGQQVERRPCLRDDERVAVRQYDDVRNQAKRRRPRRREAHRHERVERVVAAGLEPALRRRRMIGEPEAVETRRFGRCGDPGHAVAGRPAPGCTGGCSSDALSRSASVPCPRPRLRHYPQMITSFS